MDQPVALVDLSIRLTTNLLTFPHAFQVARYHFN